MFNTMIGPGCRNARFGQQYYHLFIRPNSSYGTANTETSSLPSDVLPPFKRHRDPNSILNALASCVKPVPEAPDFRLGGDPWLGSTLRIQSFLLAKAKGRLAARLAARDYFPNDIVGVAKEFPRIDHLLPLQTPDSILERVTNGSLTKTDAMDRLILLLAPRQAWKLYSQSEDEQWSKQTLHRLLDLLCATNGGDNHTTYSYLNGSDWSNLPDPDEVYFADELEARFQKKSKFHSKSDTSSSLTESTESLSSDDKNLDTDDQPNLPENLPQPSSAETDILESVSVPNTWSNQNSAEQLFLKESDVLRTPDAYRSMIRGAAKFGNAHRALELAEQAWVSSTAESTLDLPTYHMLLRSLHGLKPTGKEKVNLWNLIVRVVEKMKIAKLPVHIRTFDQILYTLSEAACNHKKHFITHNSSSMGKQNYIAEALGLMQEIRQLGLKPTLGTMNNMLRLITSTVADYSNRPTSMFVPVYSSREILGNFVSELEQRFREEPMSRFDSWSTDDYSFFPTAMTIAWIERDFVLGMRLHNLLLGDQDRRFLLSTSIGYRKYAYSCSMLMFSQTRSNLEQPIDAAKRYDTFYKFYRDSVLFTDKVISRLVNSYDHIFHNTKSHEAHLLSYTTLCHVMEDLIDRTTVRDLKLPSYSKNLIKLLVNFAHLNPTLSTQLSARLLTILKQIDENKEADKIRFEAMANSGNGRGSPKTHSCSISNISSFIQLLFPAVTPQPVHNQVSKMCERKALDTLQDWFDYALLHNAVSWQWAPRGLAILQQHGITLSSGFIWTVLEQLSSSNSRLQSSDSQIILKDTLKPILEMVRVDATDPNSSKKAKVLNNIQMKLNPTSDPNVTSSSEDSSDSSSDSDEV